MSDPFAVVREFEQALCAYTGAPFAVTTNSCTMAMLLAVAYKFHCYPSPKYIEIPRRTYVSVPMSIIHAGGEVRFRDEDWAGEYQLRPYQIWDSARRFTSAMYRRSRMQCVSFHHSKILGDSQGGAILHDDPVADEWLRRARFDGRTEGVAPKDDRFTMLGWHCYMSPDVAARLLWKLSKLPAINPDLPNDEYPDLSMMEVFQ